jgi:hypothetical protein
MQRQKSGLMLNFGANQKIFPSSTKAGKDNENSNKGAGLLEKKLQNLPKIAEIAASPAEAMSIASSRKQQLSSSSSVTSSSAAIFAAARLIRKTKASIQAKMNDKMDEGKRALLTSSGYYDAFQESGNASFLLGGSNVGRTKGGCNNDGDGGKDDDYKLHLSSGDIEHKDDECDEEEDTDICSDDEEETESIACTTVSILFQVDFIINSYVYVAAVLGGRCCYDAYDGFLFSSSTLQPI